MVHFPLQSEKKLECGMRAPLTTPSANNAHEANRVTQQQKSKRYQSHKDYKYSYHIKSSKQERICETAHSVLDTLLSSAMGHGMGMLGMAAFEGEEPENE